MGLVWNIAARPMATPFVTGRSECPRVAVAGNHRVGFASSTRILQCSADVPRTLAEDDAKLSMCGNLMMDSFLRLS